MSGTTGRPSGPGWAPIHNTDDLMVAKPPLIPNIDQRVSEVQMATRWLLGRGEPPSAEVLRRAKLAAYAYTVLPAEHALRSSLRPDFLTSLRRHQGIREELLSLIGAWHAAGLRVLLFKGFQLAEFVYPVPGARFHGDVDVLIRPGDLKRALEIARSLGWYESSAMHANPSYRHCAFTLVRMGGSTMVDVHRWILHARLPWVPVQRRITEAAWRDARSRRWEGVEVWEPSPVDALLVGLALHRCWSCDRWRLKAFDLIDFQQLESRYSIGREALWERARALRCERTLALFLGRCDPGEGRFELSRPTGVQRRRWNRVVFRERGLVDEPEQRLAQLLRAPANACTAATLIPALLRVRLALRRHTDVHDLLRALTPRTDPVEHPAPGQPERVIIGVRRAMRFVGPGRHGRCLVKSLAVYSILRRRGWPVQFVTGIRPAAGRVVGHAWVEHGGRVLWDLREPDNQAVYQENFRFPA